MRALLHEQNLVGQLVSKHIRVDEDQAMKMVSVCTNTLYPRGSGCRWRFDDNVLAQSVCVWLRKAGRGGEMLRIGGIHTIRRNPPAAMSM